MIEIRKTFAKDWRRRKRWHYVVANGSAGYAYDRDALRDLVELYESQGYEVAIYRIKKLGWRP